MFHSCFLSNMIFDIWDQLHFTLPILPKIKNEHACAVFILGIFGMGPGAPALSKMGPLYKNYYTTLL